MSLSITQNPALVSLAQSPIIFTLAENTGVYESSSFQYVGELFYWTGSLTNSGSVPNYTITKYPNSQAVGIFDLNRIINSTLTQYAQANSSQVVYFAVDFYWQFQNSSYVFETGSHLRSSTYKALDGYGIFQEPIGQEVYSKTPHWPLMTDGPATQSAFIENYGTSGVYTGDAGAPAQPTKVFYRSSTGATAEYSVSTSTSSSGQIAQYPIGPSQAGFPLSTTGLEWFSVEPTDGFITLGDPIRYEINCTQKYPNIRIKWKNRYGQFDFMNFDMVNRQSFSTERKTYQPQLGSWESSTLSYQNYDSANLAYIVDSKQGISVNTNWLPETYNEILKQLLVSDEIYWIQDESTNSLMPLTITTQNIVFKTGVVDKLIQYQFEFNLGQPYKLIM
jgi:hypothetical protein